MKVLSAKQARKNAPWNQPNFDRDYIKKVMLYTFTIIDQRSKVGYEFAELQLTEFPKLEERRAKILKRLGFYTRQHENGLLVEWKSEKK